MNSDEVKNNFDDVVSDEYATDTSMFDGDEIVKHIEKSSADKKAKEKDLSLESRRRFEALQEERRLQADLHDIDDYDLDD